jgi:hypothetical protein
MSDMISLEGNRVQLTPEVIDDFRLFTNEPSEALAKDLVNTFQGDFATELEQDPNFLTYEGLQDGTAGILDRLPGYSDKPPIDRTLMPDDIIVLFSNAEPADLKRGFFGEMFKTAPSVAVGMETAKFVGARTLKRPPTNWLSATVQLGTPVVAGIGASFLTYDFMDDIEEQLLGPDQVVPPGQRPALEMARTLGGSIGGLSFGFQIRKDVGWGAANLLNGLSEGVKPNKAMRFSAAAEELLGNLGKTSRAAPKSTIFAETVVGGGASLGAYGAESIAPGSTPARLFGEFAGGNTFASFVARALPTTLARMEKIIETADPQSIEQQAINARQKRIFDRINEIYETYGGDYVKLTEELNNPEIRGLFDELFPGVKFTAAQRTGDPVLMAVESAQASNNMKLDAARQKADADAKEFGLLFINSLIQEGSETSLREAARLRKSMFEDTINTRLRNAVDDLITARQRLSDQPGQTANVSRANLSLQLGNVIDQQLGFARKQEKQLWQAVEDVPVFENIEPGGPLPSFLQSWQKNQKKRPENQETINEALKPITKFVNNSRVELGLQAPDPVPETGVFNTLYKETNPQARKKFDELTEGLDLNDFSPENIARIEAAQQGTTNLPVSVLFNRKLRELDALSKQVGSREVKPLTASELIEMRSTALSLAKSLSSGQNPNRDAARIAGEFAEAILDDLNAVPEGMAAYDAARAYSAALNDVYTRGILGKTFSKMGTGERRVPMELLVEEFVKSNASITGLRVKQLQAINDFAKNQGFEGVSESFTTVDNLVESALRDAQKKALTEKINPDGTRTLTVNAKRLTDWKKENADLLELFPQLKLDLENAASAQATFDVMSKRANAGLKKAENQTYLSDLIDGVSPTVAINDAYSSKNPINEFRKLFRLTSLKSLKDEKPQIQQAWQTAILQRGLMEAGGQGTGFSPSAFYRFMFEPLPNHPRTSLADLMESYDIMSKQDMRRMRFISKQLVRVEAADAAGKLNDPEFMAQAGPILDFYTSIAGSALGTKLGSTLTGGQPGPGALKMAQSGSSMTKDILMRVPASRKLELLELTFLDPDLTVSLMAKPQNQKDKARVFSKVNRFLQEQFGVRGAAMQPYLLREGAEEEDTGTGVSEEEFLNEIGDQTSIDPSLIPQQVPTQQVAPPTTALASAAPVQPQPVAPPPVASGPVDRSRYAAMFPTDIASSMIRQQGIGSLMG